MTTATTFGTFRIAGGGISSSRYAANTVGERRALIDRAGDEFAVLDRYRGVVRIPDDRSVPELIEFMRVGVAGDHGAAEYVRFRLDGDEQTIYATHNPNPTRGQPRVLYDACVPTYFPPNTVVPLETVRQLMLDFALHGEWLHATAWRAHEHMVA